MNANLKAKKLCNWRRRVASLVAARKKSVFAISIVTDDWMCSWVVLFQINAPIYKRQWDYRLVEGVVGFYHT
jgi:hypothetical protein